MKGTTARQILFLGILTLLCSCNSDIFIEDFLPEVPQAIVITEADNSKEVHFNADNWALFDITPLSTMPSSTTYTTLKAYTPDGKPVSFPSGEREYGMLHYTNDFIDFQVEKKSGNKLKIVLHENLLNDDVEMQVTVGNDYKTEQIELLLAPTQKYKIDSVVYDWNQLIIYKNHIERMESIIINNQHATMPVSFYFHPYKNSVHKVRFYNSSIAWDEDEEKFTYLLGTPLPQITIPEIVNSKPVLNNTKAAFGINYQELETNLDKELSVKVTVDGGDIREVILFNNLEYYVVPYKVYLSNPSTDKKLLFSGELRSSRPIDYFILKTVVDKNEEQ